VQIDTEALDQEAPGAHGPIPLMGAPLSRLRAERVTGVVLMDDLLVQFRSRIATHTSIEKSVRRPTSEDAPPEVVRSLDEVEGAAVDDDHRQTRVVAQPAHVGALVTKMAPHPGSHAVAEDQAGLCDEVAPVQPAKERAASGEHSPDVVAVVLFPESFDRLQEEFEVFEAQPADGCTLNAFTERHTPGTPLGRLHQPRVSGNRFDSVHACVAWRMIRSQGDLSDDVMTEVAALCAWRQADALSGEISEEVEPIRSGRIGRCNLSEIRLLTQADTEPTDVEGVQLAPVEPLVQASPAGLDLLGKGRKLCGVQELVCPVLHGA